jgi:hypothetical protein
MRLDPTLLRLGGWQELANQIDATATTEGAKFIAFDNYGQAALFARLLPPRRIVLGAEGRWALFNLPNAQAEIDGLPGLLVRTARRDDRPDATRWSDITPLAPLSRERRGMEAEAFRLYRVVGRPGEQPIKRMPRPAAKDAP